MVAMRSPIGTKQVIPLALGAVLGVLGLILTAGCDQAPTPKAEAPELLVYCGITMVHPMTEIGKIVEKEQGVRVVMSQGGSVDLYQALKTAGKGDLYLPGSESFRKKYLGEGLLGDAVEVGYNQAALVTAKGNPKGLTDDIRQLIDPSIAVALCNPDSGSIGNETKAILDRAGLTKAAYENSALVATDSRDLNRALKNGDVELILNWRATAFFQENRDSVSVIDLDPAVAVPKKLVLNLLTFSAQPQAARRFMEIASSPEGQAIFRRYGFQDKDGKTDHLGP